MDFRHKFAHDNVMKIKLHLEKLTDWEQTFILGILEKELITETTCRLSRGQFNTLQIIADECKKRRMY